MVTGAFGPQTSIPEFLTGRIHTQPTLSRPASINNIDLKATIPDPQNTPATPQDPIKGLAEVSVNLQNKPEKIPLPLDLSTRLQ